MESFEIQNEKGQVGYLTVIDSFEHYYTHETMRKVRFEQVSGSGRGVVEETCINERQFEDLYSKRIITM